MAVEPWFTENEARDLTDRIKARANELWALLLEAYERQAWKALGYRSWGAYYGAEFHDSGRRGYQLLDAARVLEELDPPGFRNPDDPGSGLLNERTARELVPILRGGEKTVAEVYQDAVDEHGPEPTAKQVRETVRRHLGVPAPPDPDPEPGTLAAWQKDVEILRTELAAITFLSENDLDDHWPHVEQLWTQVRATRPSRTPG